MTVEATDHLAGLLGNELRRAEDRLHRGADQALARPLRTLERDGAAGLPHWVLDEIGQPIKEPFVARVVPSADGYPKMSQEETAGAIAARLHPPAAPEVVLAGVGLPAGLEDESLVLAPLLRREPRVSERRANLLALDHRDAELVLHPEPEGCGGHELERTPTL